MQSWGEHYHGIASHMALFRQTNERLVTLANVRPGMTVVDLACGSGLTADTILSQVPEDVQLHLVDESAAMIAVARGRLGERAHYHTVAAEKFTDAIATPVDRIICNMAFWYFRDPDAVLAQIRRVLKPTGLLCFNLSGTFFNTGGGVVSPQWALLRALSERGQAGVRPVAEPERLPNQRSIEGTLHGSGFKTARFEVQEITVAEPAAAPGGELHQLLQLYPIAPGENRTEAGAASAALLASVRDDIEVRRPRWRIAIFVAQPALTAEEALRTRFAGRFPPPI